MKSPSAMVAGALLLLGSEVFLWPQAVKAEICWCAGGGFATIGASLSDIVEKRFSGLNGAAVEMTASQSTSVTAERTFLGEDVVAGTAVETHFYSEGECDE